MSVAIIRYNSGNVRSVTYALQRLGIEPLYTDDPEAISAADHVIFPGVGEASTAMKYLRDRNLDQVISGLKQPVLGVCLGLQLMCRRSDENDTTCLGIFDVDVKKFESEELKVPHMGWNQISDTQGLLYADVEGTYMYFVHSYYAETGPHTTAKTAYVLPFSAGLGRDNFYAVQFHPEKSAEPGAAILKNFLRI